jgi:1,4-alpha-glucan branching enzyme
MAVILDWVANHTAWDNAWIDSTDWYTQDGEGNIIHPAGTNWEDVADLNYDSDNMRAAMIDAMVYWVYEANIDGYRCDHADGVPFDFWQSAWQTLDTIPNHDLIYFAEGTRNDHFDAGFDLNFSWGFYSAINNVINGNYANEVITAHANDYADIPEGKHWIRYTTNHDESAWNATPITLYNGIDGALAAQVITLFTGGVPLIYGSQEVGTANTVPFFYNSTIDWSANPDMLAAYQYMFQFYADSPIARHGENAVYSNYDIFCLKKTLYDEDILILVNTRNAAKTFNIPYALNNTYWKDHLSGEEISLSGAIGLEPYEYYILEEPSTTGIVQY